MSSTPPVAVQTKDLQGLVGQIRHTLNQPQNLTELRAALPANVPVERFVRVTLTVIEQNPDVLKCERSSLFHAIKEAASLGLMPESAIGECYFVNFAGKAKMLPGYRGRLKLMRNSGAIGAIDVDIIHKNDPHVIRKGTSPSIDFAPLAEGDRGPILYAYAVAFWKDGSQPQFEIMRKDEVDLIRARSRSPNSPAWKDSWGEMAKKTVLIRLAKRLPLSPMEAEVLSRIDPNDEWPTLDGQPGTRRDERAAPIGTMPIRPGQQVTLPPPADEQKAEDEDPPPAQRRRAPKKKQAEQPEPDRQPLPNAAQVEGIDDLPPLYTYDPDDDAPPPQRRRATISSDEQGNVRVEDDSDGSDI